MANDHSPPHAAESGLQPGSAKSYSRQVPLPFTPLIGREHEIQEASILLGSPEVRLLTITGPGGVGKSRLAIQVAVEAQREFSEGYCSVELAPFTT